ncbi:MAG: ribosomal protein S18-alanine N-acetyltransferase [Marinobacter sp.]|nr:ribosomal protein S18-alanine N-acetyltransferase [Marinobacter sp.]
MSSTSAFNARTDAVIRPLSQDDLTAVLEIERLGYSYPWTEAVFLDCFRADYRLWALTQAGVVVGYAVVAYLVDEAHLLNLCVTPSWRQQGGATQLLAHVCARSHEDGMRQVLLEVRESNDSARRLYRRAGFSAIGRRPDYYPGAGRREAAEVMSLSLVSP